MTTRYDRAKDLIDLAGVATSRVTVVGAGTLGWYIIEQMVRHGQGTRPPGWLWIIDGDARVEPRNLLATGYREEHVKSGLPKAEVAKRCVSEINCDANVECWSHWLEPRDVGNVAERAGTGELIVLALDDPVVSVLLADACYEHVPVVLAQFGERADVSECAFSIPGVTPPVSQTLGQRRRERIERPQALGTDTAFVAQFVASLCLRLLLGNGKGSELFELYSDAPLFLIGVRRTWVFRGVPPDQPRSVVMVGSRRSGPVSQ